MAAKLIDGKELSATIREEIARDVKQLQEQHSVVPGLAAVLVGEDPSSQIYVRNKRKACEQVGMNSWLHQPSADISQEELHKLILQLNDDPMVHGILVQLPLPKHLDSDAILRAVTPSKDVDGFSPENLGLLATGTPRFVPCTPSGVQQMLIRNKIETSGAHVVIVGRSTIVGHALEHKAVQTVTGPGIVAAERLAN